MTVATVLPFRHRNLSRNALHQLLVRYGGIFLSERNSQLEINLINPELMRFLPEPYRDTFVEGYEAFMIYILEYSDLSNNLAEKFLGEEFSWSVTEQVADEIRFSIGQFELREGRSYVEILETFLTK